MSLGDKYLRPLSEERKRVAKQIADLEWNGDFQSADRLSASLKRIDERIAAGEVYEVLF